MTKRNLVIVCLAALLFLVAIGLENPFFQFAKDGKSIVFNVDSVIAASRELSFALIIALIISVGIEKEAREADERNASLLRSEIAQDVFRGVFSSNLPIEYVDLVIGKALKVPIFRTFIQFTYSLEPANDDIRKIVGNKSGDFLILRSAFSYELKNVSSRPYKEGGEFYVPERADKLSSVSKVCALKVGDKVYSENEIKNLELKKENTIYYKYPLELLPGESRKIELETISVKEKSDNNIMTLTHPGLKTDITVLIAMGGYNFGVTANTASEPSMVYRSADHRLVRWVIDGPTLPNDSLTFWWRPIDPSLQV